MRTEWRRIVASLTLTGLAALPAFAQDDPNAIPLAKVPPAVLKAAEKASPGARFAEASREVDGSMTLYELSGQDAQGRGIDIEVTARGQVLAVETEIPFAKVPVVVMNALKMKTKGYKFDSAETVAKNGRIVAFEFEGENPKGDDVEVTVSLDGRMVDIEVLDE